MFWFYLSGSKAELHQATAHRVSSAEITFNAKAIIDPEGLSHVIEECLNDECKKRGAKYQINALHYLRFCIASKVPKCRLICGTVA